MEIKQITQNKKQFMDLLLLGDEQENMIDKYLRRGHMFVLYDTDARALCVVTKEDKNVYELKNIATYKKYQNRGYAKKLIDFVCERYKNKTLLVGTGEPLVSFYENCGFKLSHRIENFFIDYYDTAIFENGKQLVDMVYLKKQH